MTELSDFLLARIDDDEKVANDAASEEGPCWMDYINPGFLHGAFPDNRNLIGGLGVVSKRLVAAYAAHFDPYRMLAECAAKRRIVETFVMWQYGDTILSYLATPYSDHPEYREEWNLRDDEIGPHRSGGCSVPPEITPEDERSS